MNDIKQILQCDVKTINQSIVETQAVIDKCFNTMLDTIPGTQEYRKAKIEYDNRNQEKWFYYGWLGSVKKIIKLISDKEEADKLEMDLFAYDYFKSVGAEEMPF